MNRDVQPDRGCDCCWWSTHTRSDRSVQSFSVESQFSTMSDLDSDDLANIALFLEAQLTRSGRFCTYITATSTATLSSAHQISENSDQQQPQQRSASHGGGCGCRSPYTGNLVEVAVGNRGCDWRSLSWMGSFTFISGANVLVHYVVSLGNIDLAAVQLISYEQLAQFPSSIKK